MSKCPPGNRPIQHLGVVLFFGMTVPNVRYGIVSKLEIEQIHIAM